MRHLKIFNLFIIAISFSQSSIAQQWTWLSNHSLANSPGIYSSTGDINSANTPGSRDQGAMYYFNNSVYIFGGHGWDKNSQEGFLNDLWKYDLATNNWIWISGSSFINSAGSFGPVGIPSATNAPGARNAFCSWQYNGEFYIFGGVGYDKNGKFGTLDDIWKFNPSTNTWTWVAGTGEFNEPANFGVVNSPGAINTPGGRGGSVCWIVNSKVYMFGGVISQSRVEGSSGDNYSDLWEYDLNTNLWTWIKGSMSPYAPSFHVSQGLASPLNDPGETDNGIAGVLNGKLYLFGGARVLMGTAGLSNNIWQFDPAVNMWTWLKGSDLLDTYGVYGQVGIENSQNNPGARILTKMWAFNNHLYLFGGGGSGETQQGALSDIWSYNPASNAWAWIGGSKEVDIPSRYGVKGQPNANNTPSGRATIFIDNNQSSAYLFGGFGTNETPQFGGGALNDLWLLNLNLHQGSSTVQDFDAKKIRDTYVQLTWGVGTGTGISSFVVERGVDSINFVAIGTSLPNNNNSYAFNDYTPAFHKNYYRIKEINSDNSYSYSNVLVINMGESSFVKLLQNPVTSTLNFTCDNIAGNSLVQVVNSNGNILLQKTMIVAANKNSLNVSSIVPGVYSLVIIYNGAMYSTLFMKQ